MQQPYHFPHERRREERRQHPGAAHPGPERRKTDRRTGEVKLRRLKPDPINRALLWVAVLAVLVVVDAACLDGAYVHMATHWIGERAATVRAGGAHRDVRT